jgi:hypothetical protein
MISTRPDSFAAVALAEIARYPGELSDRRLCYGRICVAEPVQVGIPAPSRWVERLRAIGLLAPARVRRMPHVQADRLWRLEGLSRDVLKHLLDAGDDGLSVADLAQACGCDPDDPSGAFRETLADLYRGGYASPPAALWVAPTEPKSSG